jgi:hypothetical protein
MVFVEGYSLTARKGCPQRNRPLSPGHSHRPILALAAFSFTQPRRWRRSAPSVSESDCIHQRRQSHRHGAEATSIGGRGSDFFTAGKLAPRNLGLLQQYRHLAAQSECIGMSAAGGSRHLFKK